MRVEGWRGEEWRGRGEGGGMEGEGRRKDVVWGEREEGCRGG